VSITDLTAVLSREVTTEEVNNAFKEYAEGRMKGILVIQKSRLSPWTSRNNVLHSC